MDILKQKKLVLIIALLACTFLATPFLASAAGLVPCGGVAEKPCNVEDIFVLVARATNWLVAMAGVYAVYVIVNNGFMLVITMGNEEAITKHKSGITSAILGLCMVMFAYMFINTAVNYLLLNGIGFEKGYEDCRLDLTKPLTYLNIDAAKISKCHKQQ